MHAYTHNNKKICVPSLYEITNYIQTILLSHSSTCPCHTPPTFWTSMIVERTLGKTRVWFSCYRCSLDYMKKIITVRQDKQYNITNERMIPALKTSRPSPFLLLRPLFLCFCSLSAIQSAFLLLQRFTFSSAASSSSLSIFLVLFGGGGVGATLASNGTLSFPPAALQKGIEYTTWL